MHVPIGLVCIFSFFLASSALGVVYVDRDSPGPTHDGTSWDTAFLTIRQGVAAATPDGDVWVADGTYVENIVMGTGVAIYGGFLGAEPGGYETTLDQRNFEDNITTIDGNRSGACVEMAPGSRVDGFTAAYGSGKPIGPFYIPYGGAFYCEDMGRTGAIVNNIIAHNSAVAGGAICCYASSPRIANNIIRDNLAAGGGGILCGYSSPLIVGNTIADNRAEGPGGGIYCATYPSPLVTHNTIAHNQARDWGGGICSVDCSPLVYNNIILQNEADDLGGGIHSRQGSPMIFNNTVVANKSGARGGGILCRDQCLALITNNIIAGNAAKESGGGVWGQGVESSTYNDVWGNEAPSGENYWGCQPGQGDISLDPLFVDPDGADFHLLPWSPCIDAGDNATLGAIADLLGVPVDELTDIDGEKRLVGSAVRSGPRLAVDMGADEFHPHRR